MGKFALILFINASLGVAAAGVRHQLLLGKPSGAVMLCADTKLM
ncbi:hypothetical protein [Litoreibacter meonggei]|nr:hypothetical protein [Litoreibacter meonggei]